MKIYVLNKMVLGYSNDLEVEKVSTKFEEVKEIMEREKNFLVSSVKQEMRKEGKSEEAIEEHFESYFQDNKYDFHLWLDNETGTLFHYQITETVLK